MLLNYGGGVFTKVLPLRENDHDGAIELVFFLQTEWIDAQSQMGEDDATALMIAEYWQIIKAVCSMVPTVKGLDWDFDKLKSNLDLIKFFLLHPECSFLKLHEFESKADTIDRANCLEDDDADLTAENLPFPTSGNHKSDRLASYIHGTDWGPIAIMTLFDRCSREEVIGIQYTIGELANPDKRLDKKKKTIADDFYGTADPSLYDTSDPNFEWDAVD